MQIDPLKAIRRWLLMRRIRASLRASQPTEDELIRLAQEMGIKINGD